MAEEDIYHFVDDGDLYNVNETEELVSVSDTPDGVVIVIDDAFAWTGTESVDLNDSYELTDASDSVTVQDPQTVNHVTVVKPTAETRLTPIAGVQIGQYKMVALDNGLAILADHTDPAHSRSTFGIAEETTFIGLETSIIVSGEIINNGWSWTVDAPVYLSTAGDITQTLPTTGFLLQVGIALSATSINIDLDRAVHLT